MRTDESGLVPIIDDSEQESRVRKNAIIMLVVLVVALVSTTVVAVTHAVEGVAWVPVAVALGSVRTIQTLRHPEGVGRLPSEHKANEILARRGLDVATAPPGASQGGVRVAVQDALDSVRGQQATPRMRVAGLVAASTGTLGCGGGAVASLLGHDLAAAGICAVGAAAFGSLGLYLVQLGRRLRGAERVLEAQLRSLEAPAARPITPGEDPWRRGAKTPG